MTQGYQRQDSKCPKCGEERIEQVVDLRVSRTGKRWICIPCRKQDPGPKAHGGRRCPETGKPTLTYNSWNAMRQRTGNPKHKDYPWYGALGAECCPEWATFAGFYADMGDRPEGTSIDRIDPTGNYEPGNCRWADSRTQADNKRCHQLVS